MHQRTNSRESSPNADPGASPSRAFSTRRLQNDKTVAQASDPKEGIHPAGRGAHRAPPDSVLTGSSYSRCLIGLDLC